MPDAVALVAPIQPGKGEAATAAYAYGEQTIARQNPIEGDRTVGLGGKFRKRHAVGQGAHETLRPQHSNRIDCDRGFAIPTWVSTLRRKRDQS